MLGGRLGRRGLTATAPTLGRPAFLGLRLRLGGISRGILLLAVLLRLRSGRRSRLGGRDLTTTAGTRGVRGLEEQRGSREEGLGLLVLVLGRALLDVVVLLVLLDLVSRGCRRSGGSKVGGLQCVLLRRRRGHLGGRLLVRSLLNVLGGHDGLNHRGGVRGSLDGHHPAATARRAPGAGDHLLLVLGRGGCGRR